MMGGTCSTYEANPKAYLVREPQRKMSFRKLGVDGRIILERIFEKLGVKVWTGINGFGVGSVAVFLCEHNIRFAWGQDSPLIMLFLRLWGEVQRYQCRLWRTATDGWRSTMPSGLGPQRPHWSWEPVRVCACALCSARLPLRLNSRIAADGHEDTGGLLWRVWVRTAQR